MENRTEVRAGATTVQAARVGVWVISGLMLFGVAFGVVAVLDIPDSEWGLRILTALFFLLFLATGCAILIHYRRLIKAASATSADTLAVLEVEATDPGGEKGDFAERLRRLEGLKAEGLVSEQEYHEKRQAILREKW